MGTVRAAATAARRRAVDPEEGPIHVRNDAVFWRRRLVLLLALTALVLGVPAVVGAVGRLGGDEGVALESAVPDGGAVGAGPVEVRAVVTPAGRAAAARVLLDGTDVSDAAPAVDGARTWRGEGLPEGDHELEVVLPRGFPQGDARARLRFTVDTTPPALELRPSAEEAAMDEAVSFSGTTEPGVELVAGGQPVEVDDEGAFRIPFDAPPAGPLEVVARDAAGNAATASAEIRVALPPIRAVHVSTYGWAASSLREPVLQLLDRGIIDAVQLDLKDESGLIGYDTQVPLASTVGGRLGIWDLGQAVEEIHRRGGRVIGRVVAFRDPLLAAWAWEQGQRDLVVQTAAGDMLDKYGGFSNPASPEVRRYNLDVAVEAARAGVDEILYDYIRRPEGPLETMRFPGLGDATLEDVVAGFLGESRGPLRAEGTALGASVFGISVHSPLQIAQDIPKMARNADYIAPMVYPSLWNRGEFDVAHPEAQPYDIVARSLAAFRTTVEGTGAKIVPWLQDFSLAIQYGAPEVAAQIRAAADVGIQEWIMWDPQVTYTVAGLPGGA